MLLLFELHQQTAGTVPASCNGGTCGAGFAREVHTCRWRRQWAPHLANKPPLVAANHLGHQECHDLNLNNSSSSPSLMQHDGTGTCGMTCHELYTSFRVCFHTQIARIHYARIRDHLDNRGASKNSHPIDRLLAENELFWGSLPGLLNGSARDVETPCMDQPKWCPERNLRYVNCWGCDGRKRRHNNEPGVMERWGSFRPETSDDI